MKRTISLGVIRAAAASRKPGYLEDVLASSERVSESAISIEDSEFLRIRQQYALAAAGPGTELKALLAKFGIHASPTCGCNAMARKMNEWGEESLDHIDEIVDVMQETAAKRGLPFVRLVGAQLVKTAVRRWKRANSK